MHRALPLLLALAILLAGCAGDQQPSAEPQAPAAGDPAAPGGLPSNATQAPLAFAAREEEQTLLADVTIPMGETCVPGFSEVLNQCPSRRFVDLTSIIPVDAPVQLSIDVEDDAAPGAFIDVSFRFDKAMPTTVDDEEEDDAGTVLVVVMQPGGKVEAAVTLYFAGVPPQDTHVHLDVRSVVRPSVIPPFLPVALDLSAGETLLAAGSGLEDLVVIDPSGALQHHLGPFSYNATASGRHIAIASGQGDLRLYASANQTLRALVVQQAEGAGHAIVSGQDTTWEFTIEGVPLYVGLIVENADNAGLFGVGQFHGNFDVRVERGGAVVLEVSETDCALVVQCGLNPIGSSQSWYIGAYLDERLGPGTYQATASFDPSNNMQVREFYSFVVP